MNQIGQYKIEIGFKYLTDLRPRFGDKHEWYDDGDKIYGSFEECVKDHPSQQRTDRIEPVFRGITEAEDDITPWFECVEALAVYITEPDPALYLVLDDEVDENKRIPYTGPEFSGKLL